ncbi:MAG: N-acetylneuraminate synthase family protein [Gemmatimonadota bacterium]|nr:N-acetylneuraminate synthase family protein [Gemmatimonadota bacterium]
MTLVESHIRIGDRRIGPCEPVYIIAEAGINHNGELRIAKQLVDAALEAGADAVKFQKRKLSEVYQQAILDQPRHGEQGLQYLVPLLVEFELSDAEFAELHAYARERGITFLCTPWDPSSLDFLETLDLPAYKIGSPDMTNLPLIARVIATKKPMLMSTGMSTENEIRQTLAFVAERTDQCALFHCVSAYPVDPDEVNLRFMQRLHEWTGWPVGYSGHDTGIAISLAAVAMGARMLEKHITTDRTMRGPDHTTSLDPATFAEQVRAVREVELALGVAHRWITRGETLNRRTLAKSLVARTDIAAGVPVTPEMITAKSPGMGISPQRMDELVGRSLRRAVRRDEPFVESDLVKTATPARRTIDIGTPWGIVARFTDLEPLLDRFGAAGMSFIEFHVSDRDLDEGPGGLAREHYPFGLVVHAPEYCYDKLIDLCAEDPEQRAMSVERIQKTIDLTRSLASRFAPMGARGPKIVMHVGGMSPTRKNYDRDAASARLLGALRRLDHSGVDLLLENLPPYPWYFGGKWFGFILTDAENTEMLCRESGLGLCFDTSHGALECNRTGASLGEFARKVAPHTRHLHVSDGAGTGGEGLQIGEGDVNFVELLPPLLDGQPTLIPEIWMGHLQNGKGFEEALSHLSDLVWAGGVLGRPAVRGPRPELAALSVAAEATVFAALQTIDANQMGIAFVLDEAGLCVGVVTDGDIRHGFVRGKNLHSAVQEIMTRQFVSARDTMTPAEIAARLPGRTRILPVLDAAGRLVDFASELHVPATTGPQRAQPRSTTAAR